MKRYVRHSLDNSLHYPDCESLYVFPDEDGSSICEPCDCADKKQEGKNITLHKCKEKDKERDGFHCSEDPDDGFLRIYYALKSCCIVKACPFCGYKAKK